MADDTQRTRDIKTCIAGLKDQTGLQDENALCLALDEIVHDVAGEGRADLYNGGGAGEILTASGYGSGEIAEMDEAEELDTLDDVTSAAASDINNGGVDSQIGYLLDGYATVQEAIDALTAQITLQSAA